MKTKLTQAETDELLPHIVTVIETGQPWKDEGLHYPVGAIIDAVLTIEGVSTASDGGFSTNGWQWDWRQHFTHNGNNYTLRGSGYYGGHAFHLSDVL